MELLKLALVLLFIIIGLRKKLPVGVTLFSAGIMTILLFQMPLNTVLSGTWGLLKSWRFISLELLVIFISLLGALLSEMNYLTRLTTACIKLPGGRRTAVALLPGLIGLMPMPAGSLLSAPLVDNVINKQDLQPDFKTAVNYWYRHLVELFWPIYAGIFLTEAITGLPIYKVSLMQSPMAVIMFVIGLLFFISKIPKSDHSKSNIFKAITEIITAIWPVVLAIILYGILKLELVYALLISIVLLVVINRPEKKIFIKTLKKARSLKLIFLIFGILFFQMVLELTGAIEAIPEKALAINLPQELIIFSVCFVIGILTGLVAAFVGLGYTILAGFLYQPNIVPEYIFIAYVSGFLGVMLSPSHLCLVLTNEFFESNLMNVYKRLLLPLLIFAVMATLLYSSGWFGLF